MFSSRERLPIAVKSGHSFLSAPSSWELFMLLVHFAYLSETCLPMTVKHLECSLFLPFSRAKEPQNFIDLSLTNNFLSAFRILRSVGTVTVLGIISLKFTSMTECQAWSCHQKKRAFADCWTHTGRYVQIHCTSSRLSHKHRNVKM